MSEAKTKNVPKQVWQPPARGASAGLRSHFCFLSEAKYKTKMAKWPAPPQCSAGLYF
jgi:hypothetical protein